MIANVKMFKMPSCMTMILHEWGCEWDEWMIEYQQNVFSLM